MPGTPNNKYGLDFTVRVNTGKSGGSASGMSDSGNSKSNANSQNTPPPKRNTGIDDSASAKPKEPPPKEIRFLSATIRPHPTYGFEINKPFLLDLTAEFIVKTIRRKFSVNSMIPIIDGKPGEDLTPSKSGELDDSGKATIEIPMYIPSNYPGESSGPPSYPIKYKVKIESTVQDSPLEVEIDPTSSSSSQTPDLKRGMYDSKGSGTDPKTYPQTGQSYVERDAVFALQQILEEMRYLPQKTANGIFGPKTEEAVKNFQTDSQQLKRLDPNGRLINAPSVRFTGSVNGIVDSHTRDELNRWQMAKYRRPLPELQKGDYDNEAVNQKIKTRGGDDYHDGTIVVECQKALTTVGAYAGKLDGFFGDGMHAAVKRFQECAQAGRMLVGKDEKDIGEKLSVSRLGFLDVFTQEFLTKAVEKGWKVPSGTVKISTCEGPTHAELGAKVTYKVSKFSGTPSEEMKKNIAWQVRIGNEVKRTFEKAGDAFEFEVANIYVGETIRLIPSIDGKTFSAPHVETKVGPYLLFDGKKLRWFDKDHKETKSWDAVSGEGETDPTKPNGPIPEGKYMVRQSEIQQFKPGEPNWEGGIDAWGKERVQIYAFGTKTHGRLRFYIHGGKKAGTGFGVDLTGSAEAFLREFRGWGKDVVLVVAASSSATGKVIKKGHSGTVVEEINIRLAGFGGGPPRNVFDDETERKVKTFQRDYMKMSSPTGLVDEATAKAIDEFGEKYQIDFTEAACVCKKCGGFGQQRYRGEYKPNNKSRSFEKEAYHKYEYPGVHRSLLWAVKGLKYRLESESNPRIVVQKIYDGYRCHTRNQQVGRDTTNHMGKAVDLHIATTDSTGRWHRPNDAARNKTLCDKVRTICQSALRAQVRWTLENTFSLEPSEKLSPQSNEAIAPTWVHIDVRTFDSQTYLQDRFFCRNAVALDGNKMISFLK